ncbi:serine/threonine-protein kinase/endoribonuclease IRE2-like [Halichondria panicea]|uniref:serine/threonine-protein kinase/endoribonuclease IRE2-like n=1 Tax=Halichondria panicea TaxID=6063 RepID=UPI00312B6AF8
MTKPLSITTIVLVLTIGFNLTVTLEQDCPVKCTCYQYLNRQVVECTEFEETDLIGFNNLSVDTTDLILRDGSWSIIDFGRFPSHLTKLITISINNFTTSYLSRYSDSIHKQTFKEVQNVSIQFTKINLIRNGMFHFFPNITHIILNNNRIDEIYKKSFSGLKRIEFINLSHNSIETIEENAFINLKIKTLDLSNNKLKKVDICLLRKNLSTTLVLSHTPAEECNTSQDLEYNFTFLIYCAILIIITTGIIKIYNLNTHKVERTQEKVSNEIHHQTVGKIKFSPKEIGRNVFKGEISGDNRTVAVKRSKLNPYINEIRELDILLQLTKKEESHNNVIQYIMTETDKEYRYIALIPVCEGTLHDAILNKNKIANKYMATGRGSCLEQLANGLKFLHDKKVQHRDIKPENILIKYEGDTARFIISDFDLGHITGTESKHKTNYGTMGWVAPELWGKEKRLPAVDIFSMGCVFYYALTRGKHPFGAITTKSERKECQDKILGMMSPILEDNELQLEHMFMKVQAKDLIKLMLTFNGEERPDASEVLDHPFFWDDEEFHIFYRNVGDKFDDINAEKYEELRKCIRENSTKVYRNNNWKVHIQDKVIRDSFSGKRENDICSLIKVVRDKITHFDRIKAKSSSQFEIYRRKGGVRMYYDTIFPRLLIEMYHADRTFQAQAQAST